MLIFLEITNCKVSVGAGAAKWFGSGRIRNHCKISVIMLLYKENFVLLPAIVWLLTKSDVILYLGVEEYYQIINIYPNEKPLVLCSGLSTPASCPRILIGQPAGQPEFWLAGGGMIDSCQLHFPSSCQFLLINGLREVPASSRSLHPPRPLPPPSSSFSPYTPLSFPPSPSKPRALYLFLSSLVSK